MKEETKTDSMLESSKRKITENLPESVITKIHEAIGQASMCWENIEGAGVFKTEMAIKIAEDLLGFIADYKIFAIKMEEAFKTSQERTQ